jgi:circadian clock protein KaiB
MSKPTKDATKAFEAAAAPPTRRMKKKAMRLRLFIAGTTPRSQDAIANIKQLCEELLAGQYDLEVVDVYQQPERARIEQIVAVPTLLKLSPTPRKRLIGDLSERSAVMKGLGIRSERR